jgi:hypothetical protein
LADYDCALSGGRGTGGVPALSDGNTDFALEKCRGDEAQTIDQSFNGDANVTIAGAGGGSDSIVTVQRFFAWCCAVFAGRFDWNCSTFGSTWLIGGAKSIGGLVDL